LVNVVVTGGIPALARARARASRAQNTDRPTAILAHTRRRSSSFVVVVVVATAHARVMASSSIA
jgi:hypothetical protein